MEKTVQYNLITETMSLINSEEFVSSIATLAEACGTPLSYMRNFFLKLLKNDLLRSCLIIDDANANFEDCTLLEDFADDPEGTGEAIIHGDYDNIPFLADINILDKDCGDLYDKTELLSLTPIEYDVVAVSCKNLSSEYSPLFEKKETASPLSLEVQRNLRQIQNAIDSGFAISFTYRKKNKELRSYTKIPKELKTNVSNNWIYLRTTDAHLYRLDSIVGECKLEKGLKLEQADAEDPNLKYYWGVSNEKNEPITHVKLQINMNTKNMPAKIKQDLKSRESTYTMTQITPKTYIYEDDIIGLKDFQHWMRGYGSSIIVLEPKELRDEIIENSKETLELYAKAAKQKIL